jgi:hypothetical protein
MSKIKLTIFTVLALFSIKAVAGPLSDEFGKRVRNATEKSEAEDLRLIIREAIHEFEREEHSPVDVDANGQPIVESKPNFEIVPEGYGFDDEGQTYQRGFKVTAKLRNGKICQTIAGFGYIGNDVGPRGLGTDAIDCR